MKRFLAIPHYVALFLLYLGAFFAVIPGAGHWVMYEAAGAFNHVLLDRLAAL